MARTVKEARQMLRHPVKPRDWGVWKRKTVFGFTEKAVRKQLKPVWFCGVQINCHVKIHPSVNRVEALIVKSEKHNGWPAWKPDRVDCFNWRPVRGGTSLSRHAHAIAFDIDPKTNKNYDHYTGKSNQTTDIPVHVLNAFLAEGWVLGIEWNSPLDVMHFQYC
jgi:hypothetical protein